MGFIVCNFEKQQPRAAAPHKLCNNGLWARQKKRDAKPILPVGKILFDIFNHNEAYNLVGQK